MIRPALLAFLLLAGCAEPTPEALAPAPATEPDPPTALTLSASAVNQTRDAVVTVAMQVSTPALVTLGNQQQDVNHTWNATVVLEPGLNAINITADDGHTSVFARLDIVQEVAGTVTMAYNGYPGTMDSTDEIWINPDALASASMYAAQGSEHPGFANVHDLLIAWEQQTGGTIEYGWSESFGFSVSRINDAGNPVTASAPPWWCYGVEGRDSVLGITLEPFEPGMVVIWDLGTCSG